MSRYKYTKELLNPIVQASKSMAQVLASLNLSYTGGNIAHIKKCIKHFEIDFSHFTGQGWARGKNFPRRYPTEDYLSNKRTIISDRLKKRLIKEGYFEHQCSRCKLKTWLGQPIPLELHHKDHNHANNNLDNLDLLCPNCHALSHKVGETGVEPALVTF